MTTLQLKQKRAAIIEQMREAVRKAEEARARGEAATDYDAEFDRAEADERELSKRIQRAEQLDALERDAAAQHLSDLEQRDALPADSGKKKEYREAFEEWFRLGSRMSAEARALLETRGTANQVVGTPGLGGYTVPQGFLPELIKAMKDYSGIAQAARIMQTESGNPLMIPTENDTSTIANLITEGSAITVQDITYDQKRLDAFKYASLTKISWELMQDSAFNLEAEMRSIFAPRFGRALNAAATTGTGSNEPQGVVGASAEGKEAASQTAITFAEIMDLLHSVDPAYRMSPSCGFMLHDSVLAILKKIQLGSGDATPLWLPSVRDGEPDRILGYRFWINQAMEPALTTNKKVLLFGDFSKFIIRIVQDIRVQRLDELYAANGLVGFVAHMRFDSECVDTTAIKHLVTKKT